MCLRKPGVCPPRAFFPRTIWVDAGRHRGDGGGGLCTLHLHLRAGRAVTIIALAGWSTRFCGRMDTPKDSRWAVHRVRQPGLLFPPSLPGHHLQRRGQQPQYECACGFALSCGVGAWPCCWWSLRQPTASTSEAATRPAGSRSAGRKQRPQAGKAKWEAATTVLIISLFESGLTSMVQTAAAAFAYAVVVECFITRGHTVLPRPAECASAFRIAHGAPCLSC